MGWRGAASSMLARGVGRRTRRCWLVVDSSAQLCSGRTETEERRWLWIWGVSGCLNSERWEPGVQLLPFADGHSAVTCHPSGRMFSWCVGGNSHGLSPPSPPSRGLATLGWLQSGAVGPDLLGARAPFRLALALSSC